MNDQFDPAELRELFLHASDAEGARLLAVVCSVTLVLTVLWLVRRRVLREEYTLDWLFALTRAIGAWTPSSVVFFLGEVFLVAICLNYAVRLSKAGVQMKNLAQEIALLRAQLERLEARVRHG